ncbi:protein SAWADEE HOMEODOMAIN-like protein 2 [Iris pallida]|uniref:Protein SAWADEE HOMEODOMAIN-like protein 2 n=1 Tax=Iris pallida TaxID=29817 RepID=A0AAX6FN57_IRIPA|nr:protein SAWADEE HOMEODOMAIN-like protein 2 [Iris pallida]KAJ6817498.1 protein SAWADEE HOMEODOMAIN-like protein 2 [Iris pallida]
MGRPPQSGGGPAFRFTQNEVVEMEACLQEVNHAIPSRDTVCALAEKFSLSADRVGKTPPIQPKQVWNWFQNRRYAQRAKVVKAPPGKLSVVPMPRDDDSLPFRNVNVNVPPSTSAPLGAGKNPENAAQVEFEAKSARDGAWYDVAVFLSHRMFDTDDPEVRVRFSGFGVEEDEWVNVRKFVRQRSLPCENAECVAVLPGDLILCFQEGKEQALYFDAHVLDAQRRRHDVRGCRCRFLVRYDHDQSEEIVPLRKVCRRPETDYRLQVLQASRAPGPVDQRAAAPNDPSMATSSNDFNAASQRTRKHRKLMDVNTDEVTTVSLSHPKEPAMMQTCIPAATVENDKKMAPDVVMEDSTAPAMDIADKQHGENTTGG